MPEETEDSPVGVEVAPSDPSTGVPVEPSPAEVVPETDEPAPLEADPPEFGSLHFGSIGITNTRSTPVAMSHTGGAVVETPFRTQ